jgi:hypothetical protein
VIDNAPSAHSTTRTCVFDAKRLEQALRLGVGGSALHGIAVAAATERSPDPMKVAGVQAPSHETTKIDDVDSRARLTDIVPRL